jgi:hypothetical protein
MSAHQLMPFGEDAAHGHDSLVCQASMHEEHARVKAMLGQNAEMIRALKQQQQQQPAAGADKLRRLQHEVKTPTSSRRAKTGGGPWGVK